ncbi:MAG: NADH-quinone oxidoreductase subunit NuoE [Candidatus Riflebacteria bacterium]|nr:NADH-quinone oxidoreductase subunit NuoE [Candidatus Riflebacteria bacterium]
MGCADVSLAVEKVLDRYERARHNLIPILQDTQEAIGCLPEAALARIAAYLDLSANDVFGVVTFYSQFRFRPPGAHHIKVCEGTACHVRGSGLLVEELTRKLGIEVGETTGDGKFSLERVACFGSCALAPVVVVGDKVHGRVTTKRVGKLIGEHGGPNDPSEAKSEEEPAEA